MNQDTTQMLNLQEYFLRAAEWGEQTGVDYKKDFLVYAYSQEESRCCSCESHEGKDMVLNGVFSPLSTKKNI